MHNRIMIDINIILPLIWVFIKFVKGIRIYGRPRGRKKKQWESDIILRVKIKETGTHHPKMNCIPVYHVMLPFFYDGCEAGDYYSGAEYRCGGKHPHSSSEKRIIRTSRLSVKSSDWVYPKNCVNEQGSAKRE